MATRAFAFTLATVVACPPFQGESLVGSDASAGGAPRGPTQGLMLALDFDESGGTLVGEGHAFLAWIDRAPDEDSAIVLKPRRPQRGKARDANPLERPVDRLAPRSRLPENQPFFGRVDALRIDDRALDDSEIRTLATR